MKLLVKYVDYRNEGHAFVAVAGVFSFEFLSVEVVPIYACSQHVVTSINGTTSTEEMSKAKCPNATLHKSMPFISGICYIKNINLTLSSVSMCEIPKVHHLKIKR